MTSSEPTIAVVPDTTLHGVRPWSAPGLLADSIRMESVLPDGAHGAIIAYGERDQLGKVGAGLAVIARGPAGVTFVGRLDHTWDKPLTASLTLTKVW